MPDRWIIDTNVLVVANGRSEQADDLCRAACEDFLLQVQEHSSLTVDEGGEIFEEYGRYCNHSGAPGLGDVFFAWAFNSQHTSCRRVPITPLGDGSYAEFPSMPELEGFDRSDRKFVAVALARSDGAAIANAVDSDWSENETALRSAGVLVQELCPHCLKSPPPVDA